MTHVSCPQCAFKGYNDIMKKLLLVLLTSTVRSVSQLLRTSTNKAKLLFNYQDLYNKPFLG